MKPIDVERRFAAHANSIGLNLAGLGGSTIYRDSQFELECRRAPMDPYESAIARAAFNSAFADRIARQFSNYPASSLSARD